MRLTIEIEYTGENECKAALYKSILEDVISAITSDAMGGRLDYQKGFVEWKDDSEGGLT